MPADVHVRVFRIGIAELMQTASFCLLGTELLWEDDLLLLLYGLDDVLFSAAGYICDRVSVILR